MTREALDVPRVELVGKLPFGEGNIGIEFDGQEDRALFEKGLVDNVVPITKPNTADCVDERPTVSFADGTEDPDLIEARVAHQIPGGLGLGATKMAVAADLDYLKGAKTMQEAYERTLELLMIEGFEDGAHEICGASKNVEATAEKSVHPEIAAGIADLVIKHPQIGAYFSAIYATKNRRLQEGFYGTWDTAWHSDFVSTRFPQNYATLQTQNDETSGHHGRALLVQTIPGYGFNKNGFVRATGMQSFGQTAEIISKIANVLGGNAEEQWRLVFAGLYDLEDVGNVLFKKNMQTYKAL